MRRWAGIGVLLAAAASLALLAAGVFSMADGLRDGYEPRGFHARTAAGLLGARDDLAFRRALRLATEGGASIEEVLHERGEAQAILGRLAGTGSPALRGRAANLVGLLELETAAVDTEESSRHFEAARAAFEVAVRADPAGEDAKYNLELILSLETRRDKRASDERRQRAVPQTQGGYADPGAGY